MVEGKVSKGKSQFITKKYLLLLALIITACSNTIPTSTQVVVATVVSSTFDASKTPILISTPTETSITLTGTVIPATETPLPLTNTPTPRPTDALTPTATAYEQESQYGNAWEAAMANPENREILGSEQGITNLTVMVYNGAIIDKNGISRSLDAVVSHPDKVNYGVAELMKLLPPQIYSINTTTGKVEIIDTENVRRYQIMFCSSGACPDDLLPLYQTGNDHHEGEPVDGLIQIGVHHNPDDPESLMFLLTVPREYSIYNLEYFL